MTETALTAQQSFEAKVKDRLRENIGDLMPDEVLAEMVKKAMDEMFFTRREKKAEGWNSRTEVLPSWFEEEVATALKTRVLAEVNAAVDAKQAELREAAATLLTEKLPEFIVSTLVAVVAQISAGSNYVLREDILNTLRSKGFAV